MDSVKKVDLFVTMHITAPISVHTADSNMDGNLYAFKLEVADPKNGYSFYVPDPEAAGEVMPPGVFEKIQATAMLMALEKVCHRLENYITGNEESAPEKKELLA